MNGRAKARVARARVAKARVAKGLGGQYPGSQRSGGQKGVARGLVARRRVARVPLCGKSTMSQEKRREPFVLRTYIIGGMAMKSYILIGR